MKYLTSGMKTWIIVIIGIIALTYFVPIMISEWKDEIAKIDNVARSQEFVIVDRGNPFSEGR